VTACPNIFRGWQRGAGTSGNWPARVAGDGMPRADLAARQTWKGTCDASLDRWFSTYPHRSTQAGGAEIMIWLSRPHVLAGGRKIRVDGTGWHMTERTTKGHGLTWPPDHLHREARACRSPISAWTADIGPAG
jgi:hypothetical protein